MEESVVLSNATLNVETLESLHPNVWRLRTILGSVFTRFGCAAILLIAAALKAYQLYTDPALGVLYGSRWLQTALVEYELLLAIWLLSGIGLRWVRRIAFVTFLGFGCYALFLGLSGKESCGCFGQVPVNPWWTFGMDAALAVLLLIWKPRRIEDGFAPKARYGPFARRVFLALVAIPALAMAVWRPATESSRGISFASSGFVLLEPDKWIGQPFSLTEYLDIVEHEHLLQGSWILLFYRHDCPKCQQVLPYYELLAEQLREGHEETQVALIEVPPYGPSGLSTHSLCRLGRLSGDKEWLIVTPVEVQMVNGQVIAATSALVAEDTR